MTTIENILVPFVNSPSAIGALKTAISISNIYKAKLHIIHVTTEKSGDNVLDKVKEICTKENAVFTFIERSGSVHKDINKAEKEINAGLIVMGAYGVTGWQQLWVGSNAFKVVSTSQCPVLTLQGDVSSFKGFHKIMLPLDDSDETRQKVNWVTNLAKGFEAEVLIFNTTKVKGEDSGKNLRIMRTRWKPCSPRKASRPVLMKATAIISLKTASSLPRSTIAT